MGLLVRIAHHVRPEVIYTLDARGFPDWSERSVRVAGEVHVSGVRTEPFHLSILWEVPGFGKVMLTADNEGRGYEENGEPIDFRLEAARTRLRLARVRLAALADLGYSLDASHSSAIERAGATIERFDRMPGDDAIPALDGALSQLLWAMEAIELAKAAIDIDSAPPERRASFRFGSAFFDAEAPAGFCARFAELFDFATMPFYRARIEPDPGNPDWRRVDEALGWVEEHGITPKGHPLLWFNSAGLPAWMHTLSFESLKDVVYDQIFETVTRYRSRIGVWDIINEAHDPVTANRLEFSQEQRLEMTALASEAVHDADPSAVRIVNVNRHFGYYRGELEGRRALHPIEYLEEVARRGIDYEVLGIQMYHGGKGHWVRDLYDHSTVMDEYSSIGKPIHITEVQTPSNTGAPGSGLPDSWSPGTAGWWHRAWDPESQAEWAEAFYTIACSKPRIEAITWWNLSDRQTFWPFGGLLDESDRPKPSFDRLRKFVRSFRSGAPADPAPGPGRKRSVLERSWHDKRSRR